MGQELLGLESQGWSGLVGRTSSLGDQLLQRKLGLGPSLNASLGQGLLGPQQAPLPHLIFWVPDCF